MSKLQRYLFFKVAPFLPLLLGQAFSAISKKPHKINVFPLSRGNSFKSHLPHFLFYQEMSKACKVPVLRAFLDSEYSGGK